MEIQTIENLTDEEFINFVKSTDVQSLPSLHCDIIIKRLIELADFGIDSDVHANEADIEETNDEAESTLQKLEYILDNSNHRVHKINEYFTVRDMSGFNIISKELSLSKCIEVAYEDINR